MGAAGGDLLWCAGGVVHRDALQAELGAALVDFRAGQHAEVRDPRARADEARGALGQRGDRRAVERPEPAPVQRVGRRDLPQRRLCQRVRVVARRRLQLHHQQRLPVHRRQRLGQRGHVLALSGVERAQLRHGRLADRSRTVGGALQQLIVQQHGDAVGAELHIDFDAVRAQLERAADAQQRVFGRVPHRGAVGDGQRTVHAGLQRGIVRRRGHDSSAARG